MITTIKEFKNDLLSNHADLYHGLNIEYLQNILKSDRIPCHTWQRHWDGGKRLKDDMPGYQNSNYYFGLSLTRELQYAKKWAETVLVFDKNKLMHKYQLKPYNWGYSIGGNYQQNSIKREKEEFLVVGKTGPKTNAELIKFRNNTEYSIPNAGKYIKGFYISEMLMDDVDLTEHPLFLGFYDKNRKNVLA